MLFVVVVVATLVDGCSSRLAALHSGASADDTPLLPLVLTALQESAAGSHQLTLITCLTGSRPDEAESVRSLWRSLVPVLNKEARWTLAVRAQCGGEWRAEGAVLAVCGGDMAAALGALGRLLGEPRAVVLLASRFRPSTGALAPPRGVSRLQLVETSSGHASWWAVDPCKGRLQPAPGQSDRLDMRGCPLVASTFVWPPYTLPARLPRPDRDPAAAFELSDPSFFRGGLEMRLVEALAAWLNASLRCRVRARDMWRGVVSDVSTGAAHLGFGGKWFVVAGPHTGIVSTVPYHRGRFYWYVAAERPLPRWQALWRAFSPPFWAALVLASCATASAITLLSRSRFSTSHRQVSAPLLRCWALLLGWSTSLPTASHALRLLFMLYALYCMQVYTAYQAGVISRMTHPGWERPITSLDEALSSGLSFVFPPFWEAYFQNMDDERYREVVRRGRLSDDVGGSLEAAAARRDAAVAAADAFADHTMAAHHWRVRPLQEDAVRSFDVVMLLPRGSPLLPRVNSLIRRLTAAGFFNRWWSELSRQRWTAEDAAVDGAFSLSLEHAQSALAALLVGWLLSAVAFVVELAVHIVVRRGYIPCPQCRTQGTTNRGY